MNQESPLTKELPRRNQNENNAPSKINNKSAEIECSKKIAKDSDSEQLKKIAKSGIEEPAMIKTQEIFGAVKIKDGLFLGD